MYFDIYKFMNVFVYMYEYIHKMFHISFKEWGIRCSQLLRNLQMGFQRGFLGVTILLG